jgi:predicted component of type VI protein secretion system
MRRAAALAALAALAVTLAACGEDDFENEPRPPVPLELTGVIKDDAVTVAPAKLGAGPVLITISNQTGRNRIVTLEGDTLSLREGPISPGDTATIQRTLEPGSYEVRAGSETAMRKPIAPAVLDIGEERPDSNNSVLLP